VKTILPAPAAFAGAFTMLAFDVPPRSISEILVYDAVLVPVYLGIAGLLSWLSRQPPGQRFFGHSRARWTFLMAFSSAAGAVMMIFT
jgi:hypothetical protein